ncbi:MAG: lytic transglycosylase domain-containing protein [Methylobacterium mesophilicum]|nr:lytic transglycosylase domain-containing protein [Methylobacterium mesophilicum]
MWRTASAWQRRLPLRNRVALLLVALGLLALAAPASADPPRKRMDRSIGRVCELIEFHANRNGLPPAFFARLIWKESRFSAGAVSPVGAEGIAQFMPGTAKLRGLADSFDIEQAIPASARYLAEMRAGFGNLGLAAAAYNSGEGRVSRWLGSGGFLPLETENYVLDIMGEPADNFSERNHEPETRPLDKTRDFQAACRNLPMAEPDTIAMSTVVSKPWGVQVAGNVRRAAALRQWQRVSSRFVMLAGYDPVVSRVRNGRSRRGIYAVRIGAESRREAGDICRQLQSAGGSCVVLRNR